ncbi:glycosyltransferase family 2 protein [Burkholderiales bacterium]|nr:glycosyltransferase family 2 protein [Burkholderiales bacterium]
MTDDEVIDKKSKNGAAGRQTISAVIITKNADRTLEACLDALKWTSEIIILDSGSSDQTSQIAQKKGAKFHTAEWRGFGPQKNEAIGLAQSDWILSIDSDEFVSEELVSEILRITSISHAEDVYELSRLSKYCGKQMRHSGWFPDFVPRLFRNGAARFSDSLVHERLLYKGQSKRLNGYLFHDSFHSPDDVLDKMNRYSTLGAQQLASQSQQGGLLRAVIHGLGAFLKTYVIKYGFLDGAEGFFLAVSNAEGAYYKYVKLYYLNKLKR